MLRRDCPARFGSVWHLVRPAFKKGRDADKKRRNAEGTFSSTIFRGSALALKRTPIGGGPPEVRASGKGSFRGMPLSCL